jgi:hypothetical protein
MQQLFSAVDVEIRALDSSCTSLGGQRGLGWATGALIAFSRLGEPSALESLIKMCITEDLVALRAGLDAWTRLTTAHAPHLTRGAEIFLSRLWPALNPYAAEAFPPPFRAIMLCFVRVFLRATAVVTPHDIHSMQQGLEVRCHDIMSHDVHITTRLMTCVLEAGHQGCRCDSTHTYGFLTILHGHLLSWRGYGADPH